MRAGGRARARNLQRKKGGCHVSIVPPIRSRTCCQQQPQHDEQGVVVGERRWEATKLFVTRVRRWINPPPLQILRVHDSNASSTTLFQTTVSRDLINTALGTSLGRCGCVDLICYTMWSTGAGVGGIDRIDLLTWLLFDR